jgi:hypothetical protein
LSKTKQDAAIVPRFHALDGKETVRLYGLLYGRSKLSDAIIYKRENVFAMDKHADAG